VELGRELAPALSDAFAAMKRVVRDGLAPMKVAFRAQFAPMTRVLGESARQETAAIKHEFRNAPPFGLTQKFIDARRRTAEQRALAARPQRRPTCRRTASRAGPARDDDPPGSSKQLVEPAGGRQ
jgi:hypothetical protein